MTVTDTRDRARALLAAATPGPWSCIQSSGACEYLSSVWAGNDPNKTQVATTCSDELHREHADAALIAAAPELLTALCDELDALRRHYDEAGPEHNLLALLDEYFERTQKAKAQVARLRNFASYVVSVRQPPSMSAADIVQDYEGRARAALAETEENER